jgi:5-methylcytosine-specific restriction protein A
VPSKPKLFRPAHLPSPQQQQREYEERRGSARARGYSGAWDKAAKVYRVTHPLCLGCQAVGRVVAAEVVDHIVPHKGDHRLLWDATNWQPACGWHHSVVKQQLELLWSAGSLPATALRLDSPRAQQLTIELQGRG